MESLTTHVAFANDAKLMTVLRHFVGAHHRAVLAADTLVIEVFDDTAFGILLICLDWTALETPRVKAMMASSGDMLNDR